MNKIIVFCSLIASISAIQTTAERLGFPMTALDEYVALEEPAYTWKDTGERVHGAIPTTHGLEHYTGYVLNMTSQTWLTEADSNRHVWWHILVVIIPENVQKMHEDHEDWSMLYMTGGNNEGHPDHFKPTDEDILITATLAVETRIVASVLFQIPNQHIKFTDDPLQKNRSEDAVIAYTWSHFLNDTSKPEWIAYLPMVKAGVKALDTVEAFLKQGVDGYQANVTNWVISGASKRGWTTWLLAAVVPDRVNAFIPIVLDLLNFVKNIHHMYRNYGGWTWAMQDYFEMDYCAHIDDPENQLLASIIDGYAYRERLTMPKLVVNSGMDEFFMPDDTTYWWDDMPGPKNFLMVPNAEHTQATGLLEILPAIGAWIRLTVAGETAPSFTWEFTQSGKDHYINVDFMSPTSNLVKVNMWHATTCNAERRDFRVVNWDHPCTCGIGAKVKGDFYCLNDKVFWHKTELHESETPNRYVAHQQEPEVGWTAFFVDITYSSNSVVENRLIQTKHQIFATGDVSWPIDYPNNLEFTSEVNIIPNTFPFDDCHGEQCRGKLV